MNNSQIWCSSIRFLT